MVGSVLLSDVRLERSFIQFAGIGERTEQSLWEAGVADWREKFDAAVLGPTRYERVIGGAERAAVALDQGDADHFATRLPSGEQWRLLESFRDRLIALDIETTGLDHHRDSVTTVSVHGCGTPQTFVQGVDLTPTTLISALEPADVLVTFNGARFDLPFLQQQLGVDIKLPHVDLLYPTRRLGWQGGLKAVESTVGIDRSLPDVDGREAVRLWYEYQAGSERALDRLIAYNVEDARNLIELSERAVTALDAATIDPYLK